MKGPDLKSSLEGPRNPTVSEYPSFLKFLSFSYGYSPFNWFEDYNSHFYCPKPEQLKLKWALKSGNRFVSHVGIFPFTTFVEGRLLKVAGIGGVATHPDFRNRGLKHLLMEHVQKELMKDGYDLSILWGHSLYRTYGYEWAVSRQRFTFARRFLKILDVKERVRPGRRGDWKWLYEFYRKHPFHTRREPEYYQTIQRHFRESLPSSLWVSERSGKPSAYVVVFKPDPKTLEMAEWGGKAENVSRLLMKVFRNRKEEDLQVSLYNGSDLLPWARANADDEVRGTEYTMVKVLRLGAVLKVFEPQLQRRYAKLGLNPRWSYTLQPKDGEAVTVRLGKKLQVEAGKKGSVLLPLHPLECVRLLLGQGRPSEWLGLKGSEINFLDFLFPLRWFWWRSEWI